MARSINYNSDNLVTVTLTDQATGGTVDGATVTGYLYANGNGTALATFGFTGIGSGVYQGILAAANSQLDDTGSYRLTILGSLPGGSAIEIDDQALVVLDAPNTTAFVDWQSYYLAKGNYTSDDAGRVTALCRAATAAIQRYCHRDFFLTDYDEQVRVGQFGMAALAQFPVAAITRVCDSQAVFATIQNTSSSVQTATVTVTNDELILTHTISGTTTITKLPWWINTDETETDLATAVATVGNGWAMTNASGLDHYSVYDLVVGQGGSAKQPLQLIGWQDMGAPWQLDAPRGLLQLSEIPAAGQWLQSQYWPMVPPRATERLIRVVYSAGWEAWQIPADLQQCCSQIAMLMDDGSRVLASESLGSYSYSVAAATDAVQRLPITTKRILESYKDRKW